MVGPNFEGMVACGQGLPMRPSSMRLSGHYWPVIDRPRSTRAIQPIDEHPADEPDDLGDLALWRRAAAAS